MKVVCIIAVGVSLLLSAGITRAAEYYVDALKGNDEHSGTSADRAWKTLNRVNSAEFKPGDRVLFKRGEVWRGTLQISSGEKDNPVVYSSFGPESNLKPRILGSVDLSNPDVWLSAGENIWKTQEFIPPGAFEADVSTLGLSADVGNIILAENSKAKKSAAFKRWNLESLKAQNDFYSDPFSPSGGQRTIYFYSEKNPAEVYGFIEAALKKPTASMGGRKWFVIDGLAFGYTAAHGINGAGVQNSIIRNCDFFWIGGGHLYTRNNRPTRYGNGIEFWCAAENNLVESCCFWQIYDTAMTNQGPDKCLVRNMIWRNNVIYLCEQAYEIWLSHKDSEVEGLIYEGNSSYDCGFGWGHVQRPNKNGTHLLAYRLESSKLDINYRNNVFYNAANALIWYFNPRLNEVNSNNNTYWQDGSDPEKQKLFMWEGQEKSGVPFEEYQAKTGNDAGSCFKEIKRIEYFDY